MGTLYVPVCLCACVHVYLCVRVGDGLIKLTNPTSLLIQLVNVGGEKLNKSPSQYDPVVPCTIEVHLSGC
jgi:hypothetical protein